MRSMVDIRGSDFRRVDRRRRRFGGRWALVGSSTVAVVGLVAVVPAAAAVAVALTVHDDKERILFSPMHQEVPDPDDWSGGRGLGRQGLTRAWQQPAAVYSTQRISHHVSLRFSFPSCLQPMSAPFGGKSILMQVQQDGRGPVEGRKKRGEEGGGKGGPAPY